MLKTAHIVMSFYSHDHLSPMTPHHMNILFFLFVSSFHHQSPVLADKVLSAMALSAIMWLLCDAAAAGSTGRRTVRRGTWLGCVTYKENDGISDDATASRLGVPPARPRRLLKECFRHLNGSRIQRLHFPPKKYSPCGHI